MTDQKLRLEHKIDELGWGRYQKSVFINCCCGIGLTMSWPIVVSIILLELTEIPVYLNSLIGSMLCIGNLIGCIWFSKMGDTLGRAYAFRRMIVLTSIGALLLIFSPNFYYMLPSIVILGVGLGGEIAITFTVLLENLPTFKRNLLPLVAVMFGIGAIFSAACGLLLRFTGTGGFGMWRSVALINFTLSLVFSYMRMSVLESPVFLYEKKRIEDLIVVLQQIAQLNKKQDLVVDNLFEERENPEKEIPKADFKQLFNQHNAKTTLALSVTQFLSTFIFFGVLLFMPVFIKTPNMEVSFLLMIGMQICGILGTFLGTKLMNTCLGRKWTHVIFNLLVAGILFGFFIYDSVSYQIACACTFYFVNMINVTVITALVPESFAPEIRGVGSGWVMAISRVAGATSPIVVGMVYEMFGIFLSVSFLGVLLLFITISSVFLKETRTIMKPPEIEELKNMV